VLHTLSVEAEQGHVLLPEGDLFVQATDLRGVEALCIRQVIGGLRDTGGVMAAAGSVSSWPAFNCAAGSLASDLRRTLHGDAGAGIFRPWNLHPSVPNIANSGGSCVVKLISFDIDGTLEVGDPPGLITMDMVRQAQDLGCLIGSCSDRPLSDQRRIWKKHHITVDFTVLKHRLAEVKAQFQAEAYYHIGDTDMDRFFADRAGFRFVRADAAVRQAWSAAVFC
jgi:hypothetical protein